MYLLIYVCLYTYLRKVDFKCATTRVDICSVKTLFGPFCCFNAIERVYQLRKISKIEGLPNIAIFYSYFYILLYLLPRTNTVL